MYNSQNIGQFVTDLNFFTINCTYFPIAFWWYIYHSIELGRQFGKCFWNVLIEPNFRYPPTILFNISLWNIQFESHFIGVLSILSLLRNRDLHTISYTIFIYWWTKFRPHFLSFIDWAIYQFINLRCSRGIINYRLSVRWIDRTNIIN